VAGVFGRAPLGVFDARRLPALCMVCAAVPQESHSRGNSVFTVDVAFLQIYNEQARRPLVA
jgi:hypothetical protein